VPKLVRKLRPALPALRRDSRLESLANVPVVEPAVALKGDEGGVLCGTRRRVDKR